jgi:DNA repair protein RecO (recombination protein O)
MPHLSSPAILLRTVDHGDFDRIVTCFTLERGKMAVIAKGAKRSLKRFAGVLELFSLLNLVWSYRRGRSRGLAVLTEASMEKPFEQIRTDIVKTAYASYWCELVNLWMEDGERQVSVFRLLEYVLDQLNRGGISEPVLHIAFQMRFMTISGFSPDLAHCNICRTPLDDLRSPAVSFDIRLGGIVCHECPPQGGRSIHLSKGTVKLLNWILGENLGRIERLRFSAGAVEEGLRMLQAFVPYHLGKEPRSLKFLKQIDPRLPH